LTVKDEILAELRKGTPLVEINRRFRSQSRKYAAIREYLAEAERVVEEMQMVKADLLETEAGLEKVEREKDGISKQLHQLVQARDKLVEEVRRQNQELNRLRDDIEKLRGRGFSGEILEQIKMIQDRCGAKVLMQVKKVEEYLKIEREFSLLMKKKASLERKVRALETKEEKMDAKLVSKRNRLDELKVRTVTFREVVATVSSLFRDGYSAEDIKSLKHGLDMLRIKGNHLLSITRLVNGLKKQKTLISLEERIVERRKELAVLKRAVAEERTALKVAKQVKKYLEDVKGAGVKAIASVAADAKRRIVHAGGVCEKHMTASAGEFDAQIQRTMEGVKAELGEIGKLQEQKGRLKEILHPALVLLGILKSPEYLRQLPLIDVFQLFDRLHLWSKMNLKDVSIRPSQDIWRKEVNLNYFQSYRLSVLIEFVCEGLREIMVQQSRKE